MTTSTENADALKALTEIAGLALRLGQTFRATRHPDGTRESDTTHTVMLALSAAWLLTHVPTLRGLSLERVLLYAVVHDLPEALAGDVNTIHGLTRPEREAKREREERAVESIDKEVPWLAAEIRNYERGEDAEAEFVRYLDKIMPKLTHILDGGDSLRLQDITSTRELEATYTRQAATLASEYTGLVDLHNLFAEVSEAARMSFAVQQPILDTAFAPQRAGRARLEEDPDILWADFMCLERPSGQEKACSTLWSVQVNTAEVTSRGLARLKCPRCGSRAHDMMLRSTTTVDRAGYAIDRNHPLYGVTAAARLKRNRELLSEG